MQENGKPSRPSRRSPNYPGVDLGFAVERAQRMWDQQQHHGAARDLVLEHIGYTPKSGAGSVTYGALKRFGLLDDSEPGRVRLTPLGLEIVRGEQTGHRNLDKLREAALRPPIHATIWEKYAADLPGDSMVQFDLVEQGFTPKGAADFLSQWKRTLAFSKLAESSDTVTINDGDTAPPQTEQPPMTPTTTKQPQHSATAVQAPPSAVPASTAPPINIPVGRDLWATLAMPSPMTEERWDQMMAVLSAMKPALISEPDQGEPE